MVKCACGITVDNKITSTTRQSNMWMKSVSNSIANRNSIQSYDILDEITLKDVEPLHSEYPRRDNMGLDAALEDSLLYKLTYNDSNTVLI